MGDGLVVLDTHGQQDGKNHGKDKDKNAKVLPFVSRDQMYDDLDHGVKKTMNFFII